MGVVWGVTFLRGWDDPWAENRCCAALYQVDTPDFDNIFCFSDFCQNFPLFEQHQIFDKIFVNVSLAKKRADQERGGVKYKLMPLKRGGVNSYHPPQFRGG